MGCEMTTRLDAIHSTEGKETSQLLVCEQTGCWAVALRRELPDGVRLRETRSLTECWDTLAEYPASFVIVEATRANLDPLLRRLARGERDFSEARVAVVASRDMAAHQWLLREAGAVAVVTSPRRLRGLAATACRHMAEAPGVPQSAIERICSGLPWAPHGV